MLGVNLTQRCHHLLEIQNLVCLICSILLLQLFYKFGNEKLNCAELNHSLASVFYIFCLQSGIKINIMMCLPINNSQFNHAF